MSEGEEEGRGGGKWSARSKLGKMRNFKRLKNNKEIFKIKGKTHIKNKPKLITRSWNIKFSGYIQIINKGRHTHTQKKRWKERTHTYTCIKKSERRVCGERERARENKL